MSFSPNVLPTHFFNGTLLIRHLPFSHGWSCSRGGGRRRGGRMGSTITTLGWHACQDHGQNDSTINGISNGALHPIGTLRCCCSSRSGWVVGCRHVHITTATAHNSTTSCSWFVVIGSIRYIFQHVFIVVTGKRRR